MADIEVAANADVAPPGKPYWHNGIGLLLPINEDDPVLILDPDEASKIPRYATVYVHVED